MEARPGFKDIQFLGSVLGFKFWVRLGLGLGFKDIQFMGSGLFCIYGFGLELKFKKPLRFGNMSLRFMAYWRVWLGFVASRLLLHELHVLQGS